MRRNRRSNRGFALILTLWVLAILSVLLLTFSIMVRGNVKAGSYLSKDVQASVAARGAIKRVALELLPKEEVGSTAEAARAKGEQLGSWFVDPAAWSAVRMNGGEFKTELEEYVTCEVTAEDAKLPLNKLTKEMLSKLPNLSPVTAEAIVANRKGGAPSQAAPEGGASREQGAGGKGAGAFATVEELLQVDGVEGAPYDGDKETPGLKHLLTTYTDGRMFVNAAKKEALRALPGVDEQLAAEIAGRINSGRFFEKVEDLKQVPGVTPTIYKVLAQWLKVSPAYYRIKATANAGGVARTVEAVVEVDSDGVEVLYMNGG